MGARRTNARLDELRSGKPLKKDEASRLAQWAADAVHGHPELLAKQKLVCIYTKDQLAAAIIDRIEAKKRKPYQSGLSHSSHCPCSSPARMRCRAT